MRSTDALYGLGIAVILFAAGTLIWSSRRLNQIVNSEAISNSKAQFLGVDLTTNNNRSNNNSK